MTQWATIRRRGQPSSDFGEKEQGLVYDRVKLYLMERSLDDDQMGKKLAGLRITLNLLMNELFTQEVNNWFLEETMPDYLVIRKYEDALLLPATPVPDRLVPYFQAITHPDFRDVVKRYAFPSTAAPADPPLQPLLATIAQFEQEVDTRSKELWKHFVFTQLFWTDQIDVYDIGVSMGLINSSLKREHWFTQEEWKSLPFQDFWVIYKKLRLENQRRGQPSSDFGEKEQGLFNERFVGNLNLNFTLGNGKLDNHRRKVRDASRITLSLLLIELNTQQLDHWYLREVMRVYLLIRDIEKDLYLPTTPVPDRLVPYFQAITHPDLQYTVKRLAVFPSSATPSSEQPHPANEAQLSLSSAELQRRYKKYGREMNDMRRKPLAYEDWEKLELAKYAAENE